MKIIEPHSAAEFEKYYHLRWEILRKPWNQPRGSEKDAMEDKSYHALLCDDNGKALAVCRLQLNSPEEGQIRYMAVAESIQGKGLGKQILQYLEEKGRQLGLNKIVLDARENALVFYQRNGYKMIEKGYLLYGEIQHYKMEKELK